MFHFTYSTIIMIKRVYKFPQFFLFIAKKYLLKLTLSTLNGLIKKYSLKMHIHINFNIYIYFRSRNFPQIRESLRREKFYIDRFAKVYAREI